MRLATIPITTKTAPPASPAPPAPSAASWTPPKLSKRPPHLTLGQGSSSEPGVRAPIAPYYVTAALILGGLAIGIATYYHRDSLAGGIAFGTGTTIAGSGIVLLLIELLR